MITLQDIYYRVDSEIVENGFYQTDTDGKKELIQSALKNYLCDKIIEIDPNRKLSDSQKENVSVNELVEIIGDLIPTEEHFDKVRHLTHYILGIAGFLQGWSITWWTEEDPSYIESPLIDFNIDGKWDSLKTHKQTSYIKSFEVANEVLNQIILGKTPIQKQLSIIQKEIPKDDK